MWYNFLQFGKNFEIDHPVTENDITNAIALKKSVIDGTYNKKMNELPFVGQEKDVDHCTSYSDIVKGKRRDSCQGTSSHQKLSDSKEEPNKVLEDLKKIKPKDRTEHRSRR